MNAPPTPPNFLLIFCDDLGWADLGCYGSTFYETPNLDRLASRGIRLTDAHASAPVCSPTRASLLTGKYPASVGITQYLGGHNVGRLLDVPQFDRLPHSEVTLAAALREHGRYQTWHVGKWHLGPREAWPDRRGFDVNIGGCDWGMPHRGYFSPWGIPTLPDGPAGEYLTDRLTDEALRLIAARDPSRPFFLNYWPYAVHTPIQAPEPLVQKYRAKARSLGIDALPAFADGGPVPTAAGLQRGTRITRRLLQSDPTYAAMIENLDANIGRILDALDASGLSRDTLVNFTSDNGGLSSAEGAPTCNAPLAEGKGWMYEGGTREPFLAAWPGVIPPGTVSGALTTTPDIYPTLLEAAGLASPTGQRVEGVSILAALRGLPMERGPIYWHFPHYPNQGGTPASAIRDGDWKLIEFFEDGRLELYNLRDDLSERHDLTAQHPDIRDQLHGRLLAWRSSVGGLIPRPNPRWPHTPG